MARIEKDVSGWWYVAAGVGIGAALGFWASSVIEEQARSVESGQPEKEERPGIGSRLFKRIPTRVKVGAGIGAVKGGGKAAYREVKDRFSRR